MFPLKADLDRTRFLNQPAAGQRQLPPLSFIKRAVSGQNATAFLPSIPNGGVD
jgi:hypothetical protein